MTPETAKYMQRMVIRLEEIASGPPFQVRPRLREFVEKLKALPELSTPQEAPPAEKDV